MSMEIRFCGPNNKLALPALGLGTWAFGGGSYWGPQDQAEVDAVVSRALDLGINYFDTAEVYNSGASETSLGRALRGQRDRAIIGTKVGPHHCAPPTLRARCEASLQRLGTDRIDIYMVHWPISPSSVRHFTADEELIRQPPSTRDAFLTLAALQREGKIRHIGVSNFGVRQLDEVLALGVEIAVNELPYNLLMRAIEPGIAPFCRAHGIGIIGYMALMQGVLAGSYPGFDALPAPRLRTRHFASTRTGSRHGEPGCEAETWQAVVELRRLARAENVPLGDLAIAFALSHPDITCVLAGCRNLAQLQENARAARLQLRPEILARLRSITDEILQLLGPNPDYFQARLDSRCA